MPDTSSRVHHAPSLVPPRPHLPGPTHSSSGMTECTRYWPLNSQEKGYDDGGLSVPPGSLISRAAQYQHKQPGCTVHGEGLFQSKSLRPRPRCHRRGTSTQAFSPLASCTPTPTASLYQVHNNAVKMWLLSLENNNPCSGLQRTRSQHRHQRPHNTLSLLSLFVVLLLCITTATASSLPDTLEVATALRARDHACQTLGHCHPQANAKALRTLNNLNKLWMPAAQPPSRTSSRDARDARVRRAPRSAAASRRQTPRTA
jgi:hypothetical protein